MILSEKSLSSAVRSGTDSEVRGSIKRNAFNLGSRERIASEVIGRRVKLAPGDAPIHSDPVHSRARL